MLFKAAAVSLIGAVMVVVGLWLVLVAPAGIVSVLFGGALLGLGLRALVVALLIGFGVRARRGASRSDT
ncbi:MAG: hypothetical protein QOC78_1024 [Solirubrobacteraceae bacterium]|jgi:hypothetical protein|nr:hypothetical protein [Solirubrobacteraceae bacterium]